MKKNVFVAGMAVMVLTFGMAVIGCDTDGGTDTWSDVTSFSQVNGRWKAPSSFSGTMQGMSASVTTNNYIMTFNATAKTLSVSGSSTHKFSGGNINDIWSNLKEMIGLMAEELLGATVTFYDATHSYTLVYSNVPLPLTDSDLIETGYQINQNGSKLKFAESGVIEVIYTKL